MITPALFCRFCLSETSCPQEDNYPNGLCIKVNGKLFPLPVRPWIPSPLASTPDLDCVEPTSVPAGLRTSSKEWPGAEEARQTTQHHLACPPLLCRTQPHFGHMVSRNWKSEGGNVNIPVELLKANCGALVWLPLTRFISSFRPTPCLFTWWGSWRPRSSCRDWRWRASGTQITPERWVIPHFTACWSVQFTSS